MMCCVGVHRDEKNGMRIKKGHKILLYCMFLLLFCQISIAALINIVVVGAADSCEWLFEMVESPEVANNSRFFLEKEDRQLFMKCFHEDGNLIDYINFT